MPRSTEILFKPLQVKSLHLPNRIVMAPMTRSASPGRIPGDNVVEYYKRRAEGGVGLIVSEGTYIAHPTAGFDPKVPNFCGEALTGWKKVIDAVHAAGGRFAPQLWHVGMKRRPGETMDVDPVGPGNLTQTQIDEIVRGYGESAEAALKLGCDAVEIHAAHGYLIDQFFWEGSNARTDKYGGSIEARTRFGVEVTEEIRRKVGPSMPVILRFSQWKIPEFDAKLARDPQELERFLTPLVKAGVDIFHCSQRRFWEPEYPGSNLNLAGWTKKITGLPSITVGSVTLNDEFMKSFGSDEAAGVTGLDELIERMDKGEFDLVAVGRALIANPSWPKMVATDAIDQLAPFHRGMLAQLV